MTSTIRIKRSAVAGNPSTLAAGELAYSALADNGSNGGDRLYVGMGTEAGGNAANHVVIGGKYFTDMLDQTPGVLTASSALIVDAFSKLDNFNVDNININGNAISISQTNGDLDLSANGSGHVSLYGNSYRFPTADGSTGYVLTTDGFGNITWGNVVATATSANAATNLANGTAGQIPYQTATGATGFFGPGSVGQLLVSDGTATPLYTNTASIQVGAATISTNLAGGTANQFAYQTGAGATSFMSTGSMYVGAAALSVNLFGGGNGALHYQSAPNTTSFLSTGTPGQILLAAVGAPVFTSTASIFVGAAGSSVNLFGGTANQFAYQTGAGATSFMSTGSMYVGRAALADSATSTPGTAGSLANGGNGSILYQSAPNTTSFLSTGTPGQILLAAVGAPVFANTASVQVGSATTSTNLAGGTTGQLHYQTGIGTSGFVGPGTLGQLLVSGGTAVPVYTNTASIYVGRATTGDTWTTARTVTFTGDTTGTFSIDGSADVASVNLTIQPNSVALGTDTTGDYVSNGATSGFGISGSTTGETQTFTVTANSTSANTVSTIVFRDGAGNFSAGTVAATSVTSIYSYTKLTDIEGFLNVYQTGTTLIPLLDFSIARFISDTNQYAEVYHKNVNNGSESSADFVVYNDRGDGVSFYLDMGMNSSNFSSAAYPLFPANSSYLLAGGGDGTPGNVSHLYIGAGTTSSDLVFFAGGLETSHVRAAIHGDTGNFLIGTTVDVTGERLQVAGTATVSRDLFVAGAVYSSAAITAPTQLTTKLYVDQAVSSGIHIHPSVRVEVYGVLPAVYAVGGTAHTITSITSGTNMVMSAPHSLLVNDQIVFDSTLYGVTSSTAYYVAYIPTSSSIQVSASYNSTELTTLTDGTGYTLAARANYGVGATLTNTGTQARLVTGGVTLNDNDRVLIDHQLNSNENGVYVVSNTGTNSTNWVLTRASDQNKYSPAAVLGMSAGDYVYVTEGTPGAGESYVLTTSGDIIPGVTTLAYTLFSAAISYNVIAPLDLTGNTISLTGVVDATHGGTNVSSVATGDLLYGTGANTWGNLAVGAAYKSLMVNAGGTQLEWNAVPLNQAGAVSGQLPVGGGGTGAATSATARINLGLAIGTDIPSLTGTGASGSWAIDITGASSTSTNLAGGTANQFAYQIAAGVTSFASTGSMYVGAAGSSVNLFGGTANQFAYQTGAGATSFMSTGSMYVGNASTATHLAGGTVGQIPYQTGAGATSFVSTGSMYVGAAGSSVNLFGGTANQFAYQTGAGATSFVSTGSMYVGAAGSSVNLFGGGNGALHYQSAPNTTSFLSTGTPGQILLAAVGAPVFTSTASVQVGAATTSTNLAGGTANQFAYQTGAGATSFVSTSSMYVGNAATATNLTAGGAGSVPYQTGAGATTMLALGAAGKILQVSTNTNAIVWGDIDGGTY